MENRRVTETCGGKFGKEIVAEKGAGVGEGNEEEVVLPTEEEEEEEEEVVEGEDDEA